MALLTIKTRTRRTLLALRTLLLVARRTAIALVARTAFVTLVALITRAAIVALITRAAIVTLAAIVAARLGLGLARRGHRTRGGINDRSQILGPTLGGGGIEGNGLLLAALRLTALLLATLRLAAELALTTVATATTTTTTATTATGLALRLTFAGHGAVIARSILVVGIAFARFVVVAIIVASLVSDSREGGLVQHLGTGRRHGLDGRLARRSRSKGGGLGGGFGL